MSTIFEPWNHGSRLEFAASAPSEERVRLRLLHTAKLR